MRLKAQYRKIHISHKIYLKFKIFIKMSLQDILAKIIMKAEQEASSIYAQGEKEAETLEKNLNKEIDKECEMLEKKTLSKIDSAGKKSESLAHMQGKRFVLKKKQEILEEALKAIVKSVSSIPAKEYEQLLTQLMESIDTHEGTIFPAEGKENSTKGAIKIAKKSFKVGPSKGFQGGFILESDSADYDMRFETLVHKVFKQELQSYINQQLFHK
jgi:V/A-type H+/Na+-transporting ATPase subunit E